MKVPSCIAFLILVPVFFIRLNLSAQESDSAFYQAAVYNAIAFYQQSVQDLPRIYNGREYKPYRIAFIKGQPFFQSDKFAEGTITYEDGFYKNVQLLYDEVKDMVIIETGKSIELIMKRIGRFTISGHSFTRLLNDSLNNRFDNSFYEQLYNGKIQVYKKETKAIEEDLSDTEGVRGIVRSKKYYYIKKGARYYVIRNKNGLYEALQEKRSQIQQYIKSSNLDFKNDTDNTLASVAAYYDQLTR